MTQGSGYTSGPESIGELFAAEPAVQLVAPGGSLVPSSLHLAGNEGHLRELLAEHGLDPVNWLDMAYAAGSMWAARSAALQLLLSHSVELQSLEPEHGQTDGARAHPWKRLISSVLRIKNTAVAGQGLAYLTGTFAGHPWAPLAKSTYAITA